MTLVEKGREELSKGDRVPLRDLLAEAKNELVEARRELDRAREQIHIQRESLEQEFSSLSRIRAQVTAEKAAAEKLADEFRSDWERLKQDLASFGEAARSLAERQTRMVDLVKSKHEEAQVLSKQVSDSTGTLRRQLGPDFESRLGALTDDLEKSGAFMPELEKLTREARSVNERIDDLTSSIHEQVEKQHGDFAREIESVSKRIGELAEAGRRAQSSLTPAEDLLERIEGSRRSVEEMSRRLEETLSTIPKVGESLTSRLASIGEKSAADQQRLTELTKSTNENLERLTASTTGAISQLENELERVKTARQEIIEPLQKKQQELSAILQALSETSRQTASQHGKIAGDMASAATTIERLAQVGQDTKRNMEPVAEILQGIQKSIERDANASRQLEESLATVRASTESLLGQMRTTVERLTTRENRDDRLVTGLSASVGKLDELEAHAKETISRIENELAQTREKDRQVLALLTDKRQELSAAFEKLTGLRSKGEQDLQEISKSLGLEGFVASAKQLIEGVENDRQRSKTTRTQIAGALEKARQELELPLQSIVKASQETAKEYGEAAGSVAATIKEIDSQRKELNNSENVLKANLERLQAERMSLDERLAAFKAEREKRAAARKKGICTTCGRRVRPEDVFCDRCGTSVLSATND